MRLFGNKPKYKPKHLLFRKGGYAERVPAILIAAGFITLLTAGAIEVYSIVDNYLAGQRAQIILAQIRAEESEPTLKSKPTPTSEFEMQSNSTAIDDTVGAEPSPAAPEPSVPPDNTASEDPSSPKPQYATIGVVSIPKLALELPVLSEYSDNLLKVSVCRYEGEAQENPVRLVVAGHNYKSHFGNLSSLALDDEVCFQNSAGTVFNYTVTEITEISMYDHEALEQGEWDITLFTCASDRSRRILVRCAEIFANKEVYAFLP